MSEVELGVGLDVTPGSIKSLLFKWSNNPVRMKLLLALGHVDEETTRQLLRFSIIRPKSKTKLNKAAYSFGDRPKVGIT